MILNFEQSELGVVLSIYGIIISNNDIMFSVVLVYLSVFLSRSI